MKRTLIICFAFALMILAGAFGSVQAQESAKPSTPSQVVKAAYDAMNELNWDLYATYMHPEGLAEYKAILWPIVKEKFADSTANISNIQLLLGVGRDETGKLPDYPAGDFFANSLLQITESIPQLKQQLGRGKTTVLGEVKEGDDVVHVVVRLAFTTLGQQVSELKVASVKKSPDGWRLLLSTDLKTLAMGIQQLISQ